MKGKAEYLFELENDYFENHFVVWKHGNKVILKMSCITKENAMALLAEMKQVCSITAHIEIDDLWL